MPNEIIEVHEFKIILDNVRSDLKDDPYIKETIKVLPVGGYRSAIGSFWNAVVDDLRKKIIYRSLDLFNKEMKPSKAVKKYEDFQDNVNDEMLIDGAYKMGIISWEGQKVLKHAKETRHIFDGHPKSTDPTPLKVLSMIEDCIKYVLSQDYPPQIIDIDEYTSLMETNDFDRNEISISNSLSDLPDVYLTKFVNILFCKYVDKNCSSIMRTNIDAVAPILWRQLNSDTMTIVAHRVDTEINSADKNRISSAFDFIKMVGGIKYLSVFSKKYLLDPIISRLENHVDEFEVENECVDKLVDYASYIPRELSYRYVNALTQTYVGKKGFSSQWSRTDFYADRAAIRIPSMFEKFDSHLIDCFVECVTKNTLLKQRIISSNVKMRRLRTLGNILFSNLQDSSKNKDFFVKLTDESMEEDFIKLIR